MHDPLGTHCLLELFGCPEQVLTDLTLIEQAVRQTASEAQTTLIELTSHQFATGGITAVALLAESHISIHTWPEHGYAAADLFTCNLTGDPAAACRALAERLDAEDTKLQTLRRGHLASLRR
jgi:S-adenosylmethionine decarboxylase